MDREKINIIRRIYRQKDIENIEKRVNLFGVNQTLTTENFLSFRFFSSLVIFLFVFLFIKDGFVYAPLISALYYYMLYYIVIEMPLKRRIKKLDHEAFYYFEVLTLTLESGRNFENAIDITCQHIDSDLSKEFKETLYQIKFGKTLSEALTDMRLRIPSEAVNNIILNITQSNIFGNSILETMHNQVSYLRNKQILDVKAEIAKIPTKISVFSVLFFIPLIMLIIIAPLVIEFILNT